jgi:hypothetical protein
MKLADLIDKLIEIQNSESGDKEVKISLESEGILVNNNTLNQELYDKYKDYPGISDLHELWQAGDKQALIDLNFELRECLLCDIISEAVEFEKTMPLLTSNRHRIRTIYNYIQRRVK